MRILPDDMYDAIPPIVPFIPTSAKYVAGYVDSIHYTWPQTLWDRFPRALHITITTRGLVAADFADVETGDLSAQDGYDLVQEKKAKGIYCNHAKWQEVQDIFNVNRKTQPPYWIAQYPGGGRVLPVLNGIEAMAHQYFNSNPYDKSVVSQELVDLITGGKIMTDPFLTQMPKDADGNPNPPSGSYAWHILHTEQVTNDLRNPGSALLSALTKIGNSVTADTVLDQAEQVALNSLATSVNAAHQIDLTAAAEANIASDVASQVGGMLPKGWTINVTPAA